MLNTLMNTGALAPDITSSTTPGLIDRLRGYLGRERTENNVEAFIKANGGVLTDQLEREISRRYGGLAGK